jgi:hypothetical protein
MLVAGLVAVTGHATVMALVSAEETALAKYQSVLIKDVPHVRQKPDFCGEACAEMALRKLGKQLDQDFVFDQAGLDPTLGRGCYTRELAVALKRIGFQTGKTWYGVSTADAERQMESLFGELHADLIAGVPSILCMHYNDQPNTTEHFRLLLGYDAQTDEVIYHEPAVDRGAYRRMKRAVLLDLWPLKYNARQWTVVRFRLQPGRIVDSPATTSLTDADYAQHIMRLKAKLQELKSKQLKLKKERDAEIAAEIAKERAARAEGEEYVRKELVRRTVSEFHIVLQKPFVVIGDESLAMVRRRSQGTIKWAVERLKRDYFNKDPDHLINIWLFRDKPSYEQNTYDIFSTRPHTPFGYYSPSEKALVMNISTGGGTLVHEIVHPFMAANFPDCPAWLNEGMGSLYEQCQDNRGHIWGLTNWRLRGLHEALKDEENEIPTFEELCHTTTREFYNQDPGTNYSQARYLCYYLQQQGLLVKFYHDFRKSVKDDPTGYKTLQRVLDEKDMEVFQEKWTEFVLKLRF